MPREEQNNPINKKQNKYKKLSCPFCESRDVIKWCKRKTKNRGLIQRYCCKDCSRKFTVDDGFFRMRNTPEKITQSLHLFFSGVSLRKTQEHLGVFCSHNCSYITILKWVRKYAKLVGDFTDRLELKSSEEIQIDEMEYKTKGKKSWFVDVIDSRTRYMTTSGFFKRRSKSNLTKVLRNAKNKTKEQVKVVYTDGNKVYPSILRKTFGLNKLKAKSKITHIPKIASEDGFNHRIERLHNSVRERTKIFRGFGALQSAKVIMKGYEIFYNFCRKHQAINKYPYELATDLELGNNKWLDLIYYTKGGKSI